LKEWGRCAVREKTQETIAVGKVLLVRTVAGPAIGFGHLRRTLTLARMLRPAVSSLFLLDAGDRDSQEQVRNCHFGCCIYKPRKPWPEQASPSAVLIDTRRVQGLRGLIAEAHRREVPVVSIHDLGLALVASDLAIDGSARPFAAVSGVAAIRRRAGPSFIVLDPAYTRYRRRSRQVRRQARKIFVNLGGGDSRRYYRKVLAGLQQTGLALDVVGVPGFVDWGQADLAREDWRPLHFRWAARNESIAALVSRADLAITGGGIAAYEALSVGTPLCALSYDRAQRMTVRTLAESGLCVDLGYGKSLAPSRLALQCRRLAGDQELRRMLALQGLRTVDGRGALRVCRILRAVMAGHIPEGIQAKSR